MRCRLCGTTGGVISRSRKRTPWNELIPSEYEDNQRINWMILAEYVANVNIDGINKKDVMDRN